MSKDNKKEEALKKLIGDKSNIRQEYGSYMSHYHCWHQNQHPACGIPLENHKQCCLCDTPSTPNQTKEGWEEVVDKLWAKDDEPRLRDFIIPYIHSTILPQERKRVVEIIEGMKRIRKPTHGTCCTCQTCGGDNEYECDCPRNKLLDDILTLLKK